MKKTILVFGITLAILMIAATFGLGAIAGPSIVNGQDTIVVGAANMGDGVPTPEGYEVLGGGNRP